MTEEHAGMGREEHATGIRKRVDFPKAWGDPPLDPERRAEWIRRAIADGVVARAAGEEVDWLHRASPQQAVDWLIANIESPALQHAARAALLEARRPSP